MELEDVKQLWQQYDKQLKHTQALNTQIVSNMLKERSRNDLRKILNYEYLSMAIAAIVLLLLTISASRVGSNAFMVACLVASFAFCIAALVTGYYKTNLLSNTSFDQPVAQAMEKLNRFNLFLTKERIVSTMILPLLIFALAAVGRKLVWDEDILEHMRFWGPVLFVAFAIGIAANVMLYRNMYFKKLSLLKQSLEEIAQFRQG